MTVLPVLNSVTISVKINGDCCPEFDDDEEMPQPERSISKYIEAKSGAQFAVDLRFSDQYPDKMNPVRVTVDIDGETMEKHIIRPASLQGPRGYQEQVQGVSVNRPDGRALRKFVFSELAIGI